MRRQPLRLRVYACKAAIRSLGQSGWCAAGDGALFQVGAGRKRAISDKGPAWNPQTGV